MLTTSVSLRSDFSGVRFDSSSISVCRYRKIVKESVMKWEIMKKVIWWHNQIKVKRPKSSSMGNFVTGLSRSSSNWKITSQKKCSLSMRQYVDDETNHNWARRNKRTRTRLIKWFSVVNVDLLLFWRRWRNYFVVENVITSGWCYCDCWRNTQSRFGKRIWRLSLFLVKSFIAGNMQLNCSDPFVSFGCWCGWEIPNSLFCVNLKQKM